MHPLRNGSQATDRPAAKPLTGTPGWFTESGDNNSPSYPGADWFNQNIAEFQNALLEMGVVFDPTKDDHLKKMFQILSGAQQTTDESLLELQISSDVNLGVSMSNEAYADRLSYRTETNKVNLINHFILFTSNIITIGQHLGGDSWREFKLKNSGEISSGVDTPWRVVEENIFKSLGWKTIKDATEYNPSDTNGDRIGWAVYSSGGIEYVGHENAQLNTAGKTLTFTFTSSGDFDLCFTGDVDGGIVEVSVDGGTPVDIDTYSPTALKYRQFTEFYSNASSGFHTVIITSTNRKNPLSSGTQANISGIRIRNGNISPSSILCQPKPWVPSVYLRAFDEVFAPNGIFYHRTISGATPAVAPTHTNGVVDGWSVQNGTSFSQLRQKISGEGSEREYKFDARPSGVGEYQDIGGNLHGNEFLTLPFSVYVDGVLTDVNDGDYHEGKSIEIVQYGKCFYGSYGSKIDLVNVFQKHTVDDASLRILSEFNPLISYDEKDSYHAMWPFLSYWAEFPTKSFFKALTPRSSLLIKDFEGQVSASPLLNKRDFYVEALGRAFVTPGVRGSGVTTDSNGETGLRIALKVNSGDLKQYEYSSLNAGVAPNINGGSYGGNSSLVSKIYIQSVGSEPIQRVAGNKYQYTSEYMLELYSNNLDVSQL